MMSCNLKANAVNQGKIRVLFHTRFLEHQEWDVGTELWLLKQEFQL
jgi:hypothetical protein